MTTTATTKFLGMDSTGHLAVTGGTVHYLTYCCKASAKGAGDGVVCRACYRTVSDDLGRAWMADDTASWDAYAERLRPELEHLTDRLVQRLRDAANA